MIDVDRDGPNNVRNEVQVFQELKSIGSSEACWRLLEFEMSDMYKV